VALRGIPRTWAESEKHHSFQWTILEGNNSQMSNTVFLLHTINSLVTIYSFQNMQLINSNLICVYFLIWGHEVTQLVEALCYKLEGQRFDSRWCHWNFSLTWSFWPHYGPGGDSASNRNEYQEYFLEGKGGQCVRLTTLRPSCVDCLEIWKPQPPGTLWACPGL